MTTKANIALAELAEKGADTDLLREMIQYVAQRMMDMDVEGVCSAAYAERSPERLNILLVEEDIAQALRNAGPSGFPEKMDTRLCLRVPLQRALQFLHEALCLRRLAAEIQPFERDKHRST